MHFSSAGRKHCDLWISSLFSIIYHRLCWMNSCLIQSHCIPASSWKLSNSFLRPCVYNENGHMNSESRCFVQVTKGAGMFWWWIGCGSYVMAFAVTWSKPKKNTCISTVSLRSYFSIISLLTWSAPFFFFFFLPQQPELSPSRPLASQSRPSNSSNPTCCPWDVSAARR